MNDLISRKAAIKALERKKDKNAKGDIAGFYNKIIQNDIDALMQLPSAQPEIIRCKECRWGREVCGNIECFVDSNIPPEYHGYEWFCPNGERKK